MPRYRSGGSFGFDVSEAEPLLTGRKKSITSTRSSCSYKLVDEDESLTDEVIIDKHINLPTAIAIMVGSCTGAGIFVSPIGVTQSVGSVGVSLIIWVACGLLNLVLALCYAELGSALPVAGGDYAYINYVLGPLPGFLCLWTMVVIVAPIAAAIMGRTVGTYFITIFDLQCNTLLMIIVSVLVVGKATHSIIYAKINIFHIFDIEYYNNSAEYRMSTINMRWKTKF